MSRAAIIRGNDMAFTKITNADFNDRGALAMPNRPSETMSAQAIKTQFDSPSRQVMAPAYNRLIDELEAPEGAASIGASAPTGRTGQTVQAVINSVSTGLATVESEISEVVAESHTHANKDVLDKFSEVGGKAYYNGSPLGNENYETLSNLPKINNVTLTGNKTSSDLGIPTALADLTSDSTHQTVAGYQKTEWSNKSTVSVTQVVTSGTKIATITVDGDDTDIYATGGGGGGVNDAYKSVKVGQTTISANGEDTLELIAGENVILTPDTTNKTVRLDSTGGVSEKMLRNTAGWVGKNYLKNARYWYNDDSNVTTNADGSVTFNGTFSSGYTYDVCLYDNNDCFLKKGDYILTGCPDGGGDNAYRMQMLYPATVKDYGEGASFSLSADSYISVRIFIASGVTLNNLTFYPMIRDANIADDTFDAYHERTIEQTLKEFEAINNMSGVKNLLIDTNTEDHYGFFVKNADGSITVNGTAGSSNVFYDICMYDPSEDKYDLFLEEGDYILSGCTINPMAGHLEDCYLYAWGVGTGSNSAKDFGKGARLTIGPGGSYVIARIVVSAHVTVSNKTFYPMIRRAVLDDDTYEPYTMSNRQLTDSVGSKADADALDGWTTAATVDSNGQVTFTGLDDTKGYAYEPYFNITSSSTNMNPTAEVSTLTGTGTSSMSVTYTTDADIGTSVKLRIIK